MLHVNKTYFWFVLFLISHGALLKYRRNLLMDRRCFKSIREYVIDIQAVDLVLCAFPWCTTTEGHAYWSKLAVKWQSICKRFSIK